MNYGQAYSPPCQGGVAAPSNKMVPFRRGADGVVNRELCFGMRSERYRVIDHPVCGVAVASQLFIDAAATPPWQGGENAQTEQSGNSFTPSMTAHWAVSRQKLAKDVGGLTFWSGFPEGSRCVVEPSPKSGIDHRTQNTYFKAICMIRGSPADKILPKVELDRVTSGQTA